MLKTLLIRKMTLCVVAGLCSFTTFSQNYLGYRTGNYTGVNAVFTNPANIADSKYFFDINLLSGSTLGANDQASYKLKNFSETFKSENLREKLFGENVGLASGVFDLDIHGPSAMLTIGLKNAVALTTRARMFANVIDFDSKLFDQLTNPDGKDPALPYTLNSEEPQRFAINGWTEWGISYSRVLYDKGAHAIKGGLSLKYLAGAVNGFMNVEDMNATITADNIIRLPYMQNATGTIAAGFSGKNVSGFEGKEIIGNEGYGFGTDIGFVYEFRPDAEMQTTEGMHLANNYKKLYKFKVGVAVLDLGSVLYKTDIVRSGTYALNITGAKRLYLDELKNKDVDDYNSFFKNNPDLFTPVNTKTEDEYSVSLPTTLQLETDYLINDGFYLNLSGQISFSNNDRKFYNNRTYNAITFTPRYEDKIWGIYIPFNYNQLTKMNVGLSARIGPFFIGSGSVLTALFGNSKQADVHIGLRIGELK
ncbi:MAG: hypothetical protein J7497_02500 [Chitinophagaceae bacterium]|nr:hypothetical protein [Chitinophagaceae bacterium]